jgi:hypothetical protein
MAGGVVEITWMFSMSVFRDKAGLKRRELSPTVVILRRIR